MADLKINPKFRDAVPAPAQCEVEQLKRNLIDDGRCIDTLESWKGQLVDGHHRMGIAKELGWTSGKQYRVFPLPDSMTEAEVITYIKAKHAGRRNLGKAARNELIAQLYQEEQSADTMSAGASSKTPAKPRENATNKIGKSGAPPERVSDKVGKQTGVSGRTVERVVHDQKIIESLPPKLKIYVQDESNKITAKELAKIDANRDRLQEVERSLRVGQSQDARQAWQVVHGKTIGQMRSPKAKKDKPAKKAPKKTPKPISWRDKVRSLMKSIDAIVGTVDEYRGERGETKSTDEVLATLDETRKAMAKWRDSVR